MRTIDADAFDATMYEAWMNCEITNEEWFHFREMIKDEPTVEPQRMRGRWIGCGNSDHWKCSVCGIRAAFWFNEESSCGEWELDMSEWLSDFCPNCGSYNGGEQDVNH